jgi:hypothetical protein
MKANLGALRLAIGLVASLSICGPALLQKPGGILRLSALDSPASMSIHEESTIAVLGPMMGGVRSSPIPAAQPYVKGLTLMVNSIFNGNCREDIWLDKQGERNDAIEALYYYLDQCVADSNGSRRAGAGTKGWRYPETVASRQPGQHVDP